ncbi:MAG: RNA polymerase factor sigma-54 [Blastocatellia bacterium]|nr:RNA polymerase factor sigma-54 [Blastocatellia bacterium]MCS7156241.1 RNA polymerase factor sigma-54 [Blastocatellia bacterium]MCX7751409.1 RNA polymerase factor sigma-54 [Blastocatellia bacterium]MDW8169122.1 RNA polymerase factor sigma-54 [Acidobacteriota bacterium]MDW8255826.1 RNA polymerase factor sigma-54 [Acidobacteriota bacterium]
MPSVKITQGLTQRLALTPQLKQRIDLLAMTKLELLALVRQELRENPVLEEVIEPVPSAEKVLLNTERESRAAMSESEETPSKPKDVFEEVDFEDFFQNYLDPVPQTAWAEPPPEDEASLLEKLTPSRPSLYEVLLEQLRLIAPKDADVREAAEAIIGCLNSDGYLEATLEEIRALGGWSDEVVERALALVQSLDPPGIGARDLRECLLLQLRARGWEDRLAARLVREHLWELQPHRLPELAQRLNLPLETLREELEVIRQLDPRPGRNLGAAPPTYIAPEASIVKVDDRYVILFNEEGLPQLRINAYYRRLLRDERLPKETRDFVRERLRSAVELLKNIEHRRRAIYRVCEAIVRRQRDFLDYGPEHLKPMLLKDIAAELGLSLSTVSRIVSNKYIDTPQGLIELRRFFTEGVRKENGEQISTRVLKLRLQKLIEQEDPRAPLTDEDLVRLLEREGIRLSRRTVTKYRKQLGIPSSRDRLLLAAGRGR